MIPSKESVSVQVFDLSNFVDNVLDYQVYNGYEELEFDFRESFRNGFHFQGRLQVRKLFNPNTGR